MIQLTRPVVGMIVLHWTDRWCKIIAIDSDFPDICVRVIDANTRESFEDEFGGWWSVNCFYQFSIGEGDQLNWLHEGF